MLCLFYHEPQRLDHDPGLLGYTVLGGEHDDSTLVALLPSAPPDHQLVGRVVRLEAASWDPLGVGRIVDVATGSPPPSDTLDYDQTVAIGPVNEQRGPEVLDTGQWEYLPVVWDLPPRDFLHLAGAAVYLIEPEATPEAAQAVGEAA